MSADVFLSSHYFCFNRKDNGGESLSLRTKFYWNGDEGATGIYTNQELSLQSYCNSAHFFLHGFAITPQSLRELADQLEKSTNEAQMVLQAKSEKDK